MDWLRDTVLADGQDHADDLDMFTVTDDVDEAVELMVQAAPGARRDPRAPSDGVVR